MSEQPTVRVLGIRHHGPGSARAVAEALDELQPDVVLVEGPADADALAALAAGDGLVPPVALLAYATDQPRISAFWPMATFSPEWQAISWAAQRGIPVRFCDLPAANVLAAREQEPDVEPPARDDEAADADADTADRAPSLRTDPIAVLARTAGYDDPERWWDDLVEARSGQGTFDAIREAMAELRRDRDLRHDEPADLTEQRREAHMRQVLRAVVKAGAQRVAVVCGAWHAPALGWPLPPAAPDGRLLRGLPKRRVALTWVPWTHSRLSYASGYGAGITSPGWYDHLFSSRERPIADWLTRVAGLLRTRDYPISSAHVIEAVRLAETLAVVRGRPLAGLPEVNDATRAVICDGSDSMLATVVRDLVVGEAIGQVPAETPTVPLESDLAALTRRLRLKRSPVPATKDLDLRKPGDTERSLLLHRLTVLGIGWAGRTTSAVRNAGTFRETWTLAWRPEFAVDVIEASMWGTTVEAAATNKLRTECEGADLPRLTAAVESCLLAGLGDALPNLLAALDARAAADHDITDLMAALPTLIRTRRYGDVRGTDLSALDVVIHALLVRVTTGLSVAVTSLDDDGAEQLRDRIDAVHEALALLDDSAAPVQTGSGDLAVSTTAPAGRAARERWLSALGALITRADIHGLLVGRMVRLLLDAGRLQAADAGAFLSRSLSAGHGAPAKASWVEGFLAGYGLLLVHDESLLHLLDEWLSGLRADEFTEVVPLLRRTFGQFQVGERRAIGTKARNLRGPAQASVGGGPGWDPVRAQPAIDRVAQILGVSTVASSARTKAGATPLGTTSRAMTDPVGARR